MSDPTRQELIEALRFYADPKNWESPSSGFALQYDPEPSAVRTDWGARARAITERVPA